MIMSSRELNRSVLYPNIVVEREAAQRRRGLDGRKTFRDETEGTDKRHSLTQRPNLVFWQ